MVFVSKFFNWSLQRWHNQASVVRWWRGKELCLARGLLFHKPSGPAWPLWKTHRFLWWRYIDGSSVTRLPRWLHLLNLWCTVGLLVHKNLKITAWETGFQETARDSESVHIQSSPGRSCLHGAVTESRRGVSRRRISPKLHQTNKLVKGQLTTWVQTGLQSSVQPLQWRIIFSKATWDDPSTRMTWLLSLVRPSHPIPCLRTHHMAQQAHISSWPSPKLTIQNKRWGGVAFWPKEMDPLLWPPVAGEKMGACSRPNTDQLKPPLNSHQLTSLRPNDDSRNQELTALPCHSVLVRIRL